MSRNGVAPRPALRLPSVAAWLFASGTRRRGRFGAARKAAGTTTLAVMSGAGLAEAHGLRLGSLADSTSAGTESAASRVSPRRSGDPSSIS